MESMKVIDLLIKISKDLLPNKTRVILDNELYTYNKEKKWLEQGDKVRIFYANELNDNVEIILPKEEKHE